MSLIAISFAAGIAAAEYAPVTVWVLASVAAYLVGSALRLAPKATLAVAVAAFALGAARSSVNTEIPRDDISLVAQSATAFEGIVTSDPDAREDHVTAIVRAQRARTQSGWVNTSGYVELSVASRNTKMPELRYGDRVEIGAKLYPPREPTNPGQFSWGEYLARQGIYTCSSVRMPAQVRILPGGGGNPIVRSAVAAKHYVCESIQRTHPKEEASVVIGMVLGTYAYLSPETLKNFARSGTIHLMAANGLNCFILLMLTVPILKLLRIPTKWRSVIVITLLLAYMEMVGTMPSLVRATIMVSLWEAAVLFKRVPNRKNLFFTAALVILAWNPASLFDVGFQLSFPAIWALLTVLPAIDSVLRRLGLISRFTSAKAPLHVRAYRKAASIAVQTATATLAVSLVTVPITAYYFNYVSLVTIPANVAMAFFQTLSFADGAISPLVAPLGPVGALWGWAGTALTRAMMGIVNTLGSMKYSAVSVASPDVLAIAGYYFLLYAMLGYLRNKYEV